MNFELRFTMVNFLKYRLIYLLISLLVIGTGMFSIIKWGYHYSIDFVGGTNIQYQVKQINNWEQFKKEIAEKKIKLTAVDLKNNQISLRMEPINEKQERQLRSAFEKKFKLKLELLKFETVGPVIGAETIKKTMIAAILAIMGILIYMSFSFKGFNYAVSAIVALIHDLLVVVGSYSLMSHFLGVELDTLFVTAVLTTMSFSVHDTIVIFDKIREYFNIEGKADIEYFANKALTETMVRSINNSMTIVFMLLALTLLGGAMIRFFILTLLIGTITGTYSSPFVATPILVWLEKRKQKQL